MTQRFEWDETKAATNLRKHGVSVEEAASMFSDALAYTFADPDHSVGEQRLLTCQVPCDYVPSRSWPLFRARALLQAVIASFKSEKQP